MSAPRFVGRRRHLGALRSALDQPRSSILRVVGPPGAGKSALVARAVADRDAVLVGMPPLPEPFQRGALAGAVDEPPDGSWSALLAAVARDEPGRPRVLVLDDAHRLAESRARIEPALSEALDAAERDGRVLHVVMVGPSPGLPVPATHPRVGLELDVGPLELREAAGWLPGRSAADRIRAYAVFGGLPARLRLLDPSATLDENLRTLVLGPDAPLARAGIALLERAFQTPSRYAAILRGLAAGEADWATVHAAVPDLTGSGQVAPYLKKLEELGVVDVRRSLDASAGSRNRRYRIRDPFDAFWFRFALPSLGAGGADPPGRAAFHRALEDHTAAVFPQVCRDYMAGDVIERLGGNAREVGGLWGGGYDLDVAGVLRTGQAFYGRTHWKERPGDPALDEIDRQIRETRYGFGREVRLRMLFTRDGVTPAVQRTSARRHDTVLVRAEDLVGDPA